MGQIDEGIWSERSGGIDTLTINRPERGNSVPPTAVAGLTALFQSLNADDDARVFLIRAEGPNFSLGGDVKGFLNDLERPVEERQADFYARLDRLSVLVKAYRAIRIPIVVACQGGIAGAGLMYPLGADFVIGDETSFLVFAHQRVGLTPDGGTSYLLPRVVGERMARELVLTAARVDAARALTLGILSAVVPAEKLQDEALARAERFARAPAEVVSAAKALMNGSLDSGIDSQLAAERDGLVASVAGSAFREGVQAFVEKRPAVFWRAPDAEKD